MLTIGLTGGIACGKSIVSHYFEQLGIPVIDTDVLSRQLVEPGQLALSEIINAFGTNIVDKNNKLERKLLREIIFTSTTKRELLENILHPKIQTLVLEKLSLLSKNNQIPYCIVVIPLLFETKSIYPLDRILVVDCTEQQQIERTMLRDNITHEQSLAIIRNQIPRTKRLEKTDDVIENITDTESCYSQIRDFHEKYLKISK